MGNCKSQKDIGNSIYYVLIISAVLVSLIPLIMICRYNCPSVDDYSYSAITFKVWGETHSVVEVIKAAVVTTIEFWNTWQGLYVSAFLLALQPGIFGMGRYAATGIIMLGLIIGSITIFCIYFNTKLLKGKYLESIALSSMISFLIIQYMPSAVEGLYWFNGAMNYGFFFSVLLIYICLLSELQIQTNTLKASILFGACIISVFLLEGGNHVTALMGIIVTFIVCCVCWRREKKKKIANVSLLCASLTFLYLNLGSPGTKIRMLAINENVSSQSVVLRTIILAACEGIECVGEWFGFEDIIFLIFALPILIEITIKLREKFSFKFRFPLLVIIASVAWISIMYCPPLYAMGSAGDGRLENIVYYCYIILLFFWATYFVGWLGNFICLDTLKRVSVTNWKYVITIVVLIVAAGISKGKDTWTCEAVKELYTGEARQYYEEFCEREEFLLDSEGLEVIVSPYSIYPELLFFDDIEDNVDDWRNIDTAAYYGLRSISLK